MSTLDNSQNLIRVYNKVNISFLDTKNYFINTNSFSWDLNSSTINLDSPLNVDFDNNKIISLKGTYDINSSLLKLYNNRFNRSIYSSKGKAIYNIEIISDVAKWVKIDNTLEFKSNNKQVETTINLLNTK